MTEKINTKDFLKSVFFVFNAISMYFVSLLITGYTISYAAILFMNIWVPNAIGTLIAGVTAAVFISILVLDLSILTKKMWSPLVIIAMLPYLFYKTVKTTIIAINSDDKVGFRYEYEYSKKTTSLIQDILKYIDNVFNYCKTHF